LPTISWTGVDGYYSNEFDALTDGPIKKIEDLKGKIVATNCRRECRRCGHARHAAQARPGKQPRLHDHRDTVSRHARHAGGKEGRFDIGGIVRFR
jgi:hypothetical protein